MKKDLYDFLNTDLQFIKGVGPVIATRLEELLGGRRILDFLLHKPSYVRPREIMDTFSDAENGDIITISVMVKSHRIGRQLRGGRRIPTQIICNDKLGGTLSINFFNTNFLEFWLEKLPVGQWRLISGKLEINSRGNASINHPEFIETLENADKIPAIQAIYPATAGITQKLLSSVRDGIFESLSDKLNGIDDKALDFFASLRNVHFPQSSEDLLPDSEWIQRLAYSELLAHQAAIVISRHQRQEERFKKPVRENRYELLDKFYAEIPFKLTGAQTRTINEIFADMENPLPMMRLVQGDVGSGKTIVAMAAVIKMAQTGAQSVFLAPTDTLARQHYESLKPMCDSLGLVCEIFTGRDKGKPRGEKLISLRSGRTRLAIGTHALFSEDVLYKDLGLVIIDEQHRFGVSQRDTMRAKGDNPDLLALSATPIPRTLSMTIYGDMDVSIINEKPAGRLPIKTTKISRDRVNDLIYRLSLQVKDGAKIFWVCPLVQESETLDLMAAEDRYKFLKHYIQGTGLVHGQMDKKQRDVVMKEFSDPESKMRVLVSTTVIEVGIDVPQASIMVIENAERFGLAALHQLRGRVGRGNNQSFCVLVFGHSISPDGIKRLDILIETDDGFLIAEQDLMMRGVGELLGTKQSGWIAYNFVDYREHRSLFRRASNDAKSMSGLDSWTSDLMFIFGRQLELKA